MQKEIPNSQEKSSKAGRLREASRSLLNLPFDHQPNAVEWEQVTGELTPDSLDHLKSLAEGRWERAKQAAASAQWEDAVSEAKDAVLLWPRDPAWAQTVMSGLLPYQAAVPTVEALLAQLSRRVGRKPKKAGSGKIRRWLLPLFGLLLLVSLAVAAVVVWSNGGSLGLRAFKLPGPRTMESVFDTQGVRTNIQVAASRMLVFPESTVAELSAWVTFPDHRVDLWEGVVQILDAQGKTLSRRDVVFRASNQGPIEPGQGIELFQQFDAWPWYEQAASFQVVTTRILAKEAHPRDRKEIAVSGSEALPQGYRFKVWVDEGQWSTRFASQVHTFHLEIENSGLKPFTELQLGLRWIDDRGKTLKTLTIRPISPFRTALPSGGRLPWTQETVFDSEVFPMAPGQEPHPVLDLQKWR